MSALGGLIHEVAVRSLKRKTWPGDRETPQFKLLAIHRICHNDRDLPVIH